MKCQRIHKKKMHKKPCQIQLPLWESYVFIEFFFFLTLISSECDDAPGKGLVDANLLLQTYCFAENSRQPCLNCQYKSPHGACAKIFLLKHSRTYVHAHTCTHAHARTRARSTKSWIDDDIPTAFYLLFLLFFPARQKSITEANLCYPRTPHSTHPIIPNGLSRRRWGLFLDFASNINYRKYLRGYRTTSCSRASDKCCWIEALSVSLLSQKQPIVHLQRLVT